MGDGVGTGDGVRDVEDSIIIAYKQVVLDLIVLREWKTAVLRGSFLVLILNLILIRECSNCIRLRFSHPDLFIAVNGRTGRTGPTMVSRNRQTRPSLGGLDQTETKTDQTIPITGFTL